MSAPRTFRLKRNVMPHTIVSFKKRHVASKTCILSKEKKKMWPEKRQDIAFVIYVYIIFHSMKLLSSLDWPPLYYRSYHMLRHSHGYSLEYKSVRSEKGRAYAYSLIPFESCTLAVPLHEFKKRQKKLSFTFLMNHPSKSLFSSYFLLFFCDWVIPQGNTARQRPKGTDPWGEANLILKVCCTVPHHRIWSWPRLFIRQSFVQLGDRKAFCDAIWLKIAELHLPRQSLKYIVPHLSDLRLSLNTRLTLTIAIFISIPIDQQLRVHQRQLL